MSYTPLPVLSDGDEITPEIWNAAIRDNFAQSPAALATAKGDLFLATGADAVAALGIGTNGQIVESDTAETPGAKNSWAFVPIGGIILWAGSLGSLPANWHLCDGTSGTPNLRDKFIVGAGGSYAVGANGGAATANLQHNHGGSTTSGSNGAHTHTQADTGAGSSHTHTVVLNNAVPSVGLVMGSTVYVSDEEHNHQLFDGSNYYSFTTQAEAAHTHNNPDFASGGAHTHTFSLDNQLSNSQDIRPPYYALAYIMRTS